MRKYEDDFYFLTHFIKRKRYYKPVQPLNCFLFYKKFRIVKGFNNPLYIIDLDKRFSSWDLFSNSLFSSSFYKDVN